MSQVTTFAAGFAPGDLLRTLRAPRESDASIPDAIISFGMVLAVAAIVTQAALHLFNMYVFDFRFGIIDADHEANVPTWASSSASFTAAVAALMLAVIARGRLRWLYGALAAIIGYFSLDDAVQLHELIVHERVDSLGPIDDAARVVWPILYLPLLATGFLLLLAAARHAFPRARATIVLGLAMLVAAVVAELFATVMLELGATKTSTAYQFQVVIEEGLELGGWVLIAVGLLAAALAAAIAASADGSAAEV